MKDHGEDGGPQRATDLLEDPDSGWWPTGSRRVAAPRTALRQRDDGKAESYPAAAHSAKPATKMLSADSQALRAPRRSNAQPLTGMVIATARM